MPSDATPQQHDRRDARTKMTRNEIVEMTLKKPDSPRTENEPPSANSFRTLWCKKPSPKMSASLNLSVPVFREYRWFRDYSRWTSTGYSILGYALKRRLAAALRRERQHPTNTWGNGSTGRSRFPWRKVPADCTLRASGKAAPSWCSVWCFSFCRCWSVRGSAAGRWPLTRGLQPESIRNRRVPRDRPRSLPARPLA